MIPKAPRRGLFALAALAFAALALALAGEPSEAVRVPKSSASARGDGRRAALLLARELGFDARAFEAPPEDLPPPPALLVLPAVPAPPDGATSPSSPLAYHRFVARGGVLVAALDEPTRAFLADAAGFDELAAAALEDLTGEIRQARVAGGPARAVELGPVRSVTGLARALPREPLCVDERGRPLALAVAVGRGHLVLLGTDAFLDNERLPRADHALVWIDLVSALVPPGAPVLFDEFALGRELPPSRWAALWSAPLRPFVWHALAFLAVVVAALARRAEFARDDEPIGALDPSARVRATAHLARAAGDAAELEALGRRALARPAASDSGRAFAEREH